MARCVQGRQAFAAERQHIAVVQLHRSGGHAATRRRCGLGAVVFGPLTGACDMVSMRVGHKRPAQRQPMLSQHRLVPLKLAVHRVNNYRVTADAVKQEVGVGAGRRVEQLDGVHWFLSPQSAARRVHAIGRCVQRLWCGTLRLQPNFECKRAYPEPYIHPVGQNQGHT